MVIALSELIFVNNEWLLTRLKGINDKKGVKGISPFL